MRLKIILVVLLFALVSSGCTTSATRQAIQSYQKSSDFTELAFNNTDRIANEQMLLNLSQYVQDHTPQQTVQAIRITWAARNQLELCHEQYMLSRALSMLTVGQYLYNQQGWLNAIFGDKADLLKDTSDSVDAANKAAGVTSVTQLIPITDITPATATTQPVQGTPFENLFHQISGK